jgi:2-dehydro-3-deoxy-L-rhamnonate dehydrogenase (NAD+)
MAKQDIQPSPAHSWKPARSSPAYPATSSRINSKHPNFTAFPADLSSGESARQVLARVVAQLGRIDALIHVMDGFAGWQSIADADDATMEQMLDVNFLSGFYRARAVIPQMRARLSGRILVVASRPGAEPGPLVGAYSASKAAIIALVKAIALENKDAGIPANPCSPAAWRPLGIRAAP